MAKTKKGGRKQKSRSILLPVCACTGAYTPSEYDAGRILSTGTGSGVS